MSNVPTVRLSEYNSNFNSENSAKSELSQKVKSIKEKYKNGIPAGEIEKMTDMELKAVINGCSGK